MAIKMHKLNFQEEEMELHIWRYMDFAMFINLLESSSIFFPTIEHFPDGREGIHNGLEDNNYFDVSDEGEIFIFDGEPDERILENSNALKNYQISLLEAAKRNTGISCWFLSNHESDAMWMQYAKCDNGIAIRTTPQTLIESLNPIEYNHKFIGGRVQYIDYSIEIVNGLENMLAPLMYKDKCYQHENEFRVLTYKLKNPGSNDIGPDDFCESGCNGHLVRIDSLKLIEEIVISPHAGNWFSELVTQLIQKRYGLSAKVKKSSIYLRGTL